MRTRSEPPFDPFAEGPSKEDSTADLIRRLLEEQRKKRTPEDTRNHPVGRGRSILLTVLFAVAVIATWGVTEGGWLQSRSDPPSVQAGAEYASYMDTLAEVYDESARRAAEGRFDSDERSSYESFRLFLSANSDGLREKAFEGMKAQIESLQNEGWDNAKAAEILQGIAKGLRQ